MAAVKDWYAARCLFHIALKGMARRKHVYEERMVLLRAGSDSDSIKLAERDARSYEGQDAGITYLNYVRNVAFACFKEEYFRTRKVLDLAFLAAAALAWRLLAEDDVLGRSERSSVHFASG
jgi:hypothetical protein